MPVTPAPFDLVQAAAALSSGPIGHTLTYVESTPSTMLLAREWAAGSSVRSGAVALADVQSAGRGRLSRTWEAPAGSALLLSILLRNEGGAVPLERLPMVAGLAMLDAVAHVAPELDAGLKWPNDLLIGDDPATARKVGGILIESVMVGGIVTSAIVGIGLNVNQSAAELPTVEPPAAEPTSLAVEAGHPLDRTELLIALCRAVGGHLQSDPATLVARWRSRLWTLGRPVVAHFGNGSATAGLAVDVTPDGALIIETPEGDRLSVSAGDVSLRNG